MPSFFGMPNLVFGSMFNPYAARILVLGNYKTVIINRPALLSYTKPRAPQAQRYVQVEPPRSSRGRYFVYDPYALRYGSYPVLVESGFRVVYLTSQQAYPWLQNEHIGPVEFYTLPIARRKIIYQFGGRRLMPPNQPPEVAIPVTDGTATIGTPFTKVIDTGTFEDPDDPETSMIYSMTKGDGTALPYQGLSFNASTRTLSGTPTAPAGTLIFKAKATDPFGRSVTDTFNVVLSA